MEQPQEESFAGITLSRNPLLGGSEGLPAQLHNKINTHPVCGDTSVKHLVTVNIDFRQRKMH